MKYFDYNIFDGNVSDIFSKGFNLKKAEVIATINPHSFVVAENDPFFKTALKNANFLVADGIGIKLINIIRGHNVKVYNGPFLHGFILKSFSNYPLKIFYMGSSEKVLDKIVSRHQVDTPNWKIQCLSPPYVDEISDEDNNRIIESINKFNPDILFIGMTAPKQEKWAELNKNLLHASYILSIGAVFDFYSGQKKNAPIIFQKMQLIWLYRLIFDFKHVWKRTFISLPKFLYYNFNIKSKNR